MSSSTPGTFVNIDVYYEGIFVPKPLVYFEPKRELLTGLDLNKMDFKDFHGYIRNAIKDRCRDMYYCLPDRALVDGLRELKDKDDYVRFLDATYSNDGKISIYIDHAGEDIMEWIQEENDEEGDVESVLSDDVDSVLSDDVSVDHEVDDEVIQIPSSVDPFLSRNNLIPAGGVGDEVEDSVPKFPIHDPNQKWDTMKPVLGMRFSDRYEVKQMLTNYAVFNGYELYYEKNESSRLLVRCCKNKEGKPGCSFRLWATPMSSEDSY